MCLHAVNFCVDLQDIFLPMWLPELQACPLLSSLTKKTSRVSSGAITAYFETSLCRTVNRHRRVPFCCCLLLLPVAFPLSVPVSFSLLLTYSFYLFSQQKHLSIKIASFLLHIILSSTTCLSLPYFSTLSHKQHDSRKNVLKIKRVF